MCVCVCGKPFQLNDCLRDLDFPPLPSYFQLRSMGGCGGQQGAGKGAKDKSKQYAESRKAGKKFGKGAGGDAKMTVLQKGMPKLLEGFTAKKASGKEGSKFWTCSGCGDDSCFISRKDCHKCGEQRVESEDKG